MLISNTSKPCHNTYVGATSGLIYLRLTRYLMTNRNAFVTQSLRDLYTDRIGPGDSLPVFCVSNQEYWAARGLPAEAARPRLELSGILAARRHCLSLVADSQLRAAMSYLRDEVPSVLSQIDLWVEAGARDSSEERRGEMRRVLDEVERLLRSVSDVPSVLAYYGILLKW
jgi:hypothetical protein